MSDINSEDRGAIRILAMSSLDGLNILSAADRKVLDELLVDADHDDRVRAIVLTGSDRAFSVGADINEFPKAPCDPAEYVQTALGALSRPERLRKPVLAAVSGRVVAGGFELALACDWIFASEEAEFSLPEARFGLVAGYAAARLPDLIGPARARRLLMSGESITASKAEALGVHVTIVTDGSPLDRALQFAEELSQSAPQAVRLIKQRTVRAAGWRDPDLGVSISGYAELWNNPDTIEGLRAFADRRPPVFRTIDATWAPSSNGDKRRQALQEFLTSVVPEFRNSDAWEELAWNIVGALTANQLTELSDSYKKGEFVEFNELLKD
jgi:enoyl-CoA hydratase/carnithine racemase